MMKTDTVDRWGMYIAGEAQFGEGFLRVSDPGTEETVGWVPQATPIHAEDALKRAVEGVRIGAQMPTHERMRILNRAAQIMEEQGEEGARLIAREGTKTIREARKEVKRCIDTLRLSAEEARRLDGETIRFDQAPGSEKRKGFWERGPIGVITAITPFNDPLNLVAHKLGPAIAAGNAVICKPSTETPLSALRLARILYDAGLPGEMLSVLTGQADVIGTVLVSDPRVRMVSFTGGLKTGALIARQAGIKKLGMELGSNSPVIIMGDANLDRAVEATVSGAFWAAGQNCLGVQRVFVQNNVYREVRDGIVARAEQIRMGNKLDENTDMGPLINSHAASRVEDWVDDARRRGARVLTGGTRHGNFYSATVLENVPDGAIVLEDEVFGPVVSLVRVASLAEAIEAANSVQYGLQAGIFTQNIDAAFAAVQDLQVGGVMINDSSDYRIDAMPFGGVKNSGLGREGVRFSIEAMTEQKVVCFNLA